MADVTWIWGYGFRISVVVGTAVAAVIGAAVAELDGGFKLAKQLLIWHGGNNLELSSEVEYVEVGVRKESIKPVTNKLEVVNS
ncbi:hypothetical protein F0562_001737 [Nyssa sinensis]|uniref:Uncharacterized protein n=1 Tax=Nyssa sinensis TaxID=561372 RepID=A0A5J5C3U2_9ASTE|nr:hypothetical protein F0562_001737 [Nyssa sinensis]